MMTLAAPERVALLVTLSVLEAVIVVATTAPVTLPVTAPIKPLVEVTGPEKVVFAILRILTCELILGCICLHVVSRDCQIHRMTPVQLLYTISDISTQYLNKKSPPVGGGLRLYKGDKTVLQYHLSRVS
jgi:hypothetical protein